MKTHCSPHSSPRTQFEVMAELQSMRLAATMAKLEHSRLQKLADKLEAHLLANIHTYPRN
jgi:hypothetical protein